MAEQLNCTIEADFSFMQTDYHWELERFFNITYKYFEHYDHVEFYYRLGPKVNFSTEEYTAVNIRNGLSIINSQGGLICRYQLKLSSIETEKLLAARTSEGWLPITALIRAKNDDSETVYETHTTFNYYLELPPELSTTINMGLVTNNPGEIKVSWQPAIELDNSDAENSPDSLDGYSIEVFHCPANLDAANAENFTRIKGLHWKDEDPITGMPTTGVYKLVKVSDTVEPIAESEGEEDILTFVGPGTDFEVRIENPLAHEFYFNPKHLDIKPGDSYKFVIYPYSHYEGSLIAPQGTESNIGKVPKGIVRVRTVDSWVDGQVWVYTTNGWVQAEAIYTKTDSGWKEAQ